jgi:hypothetical protein
VAGLDEARPSRHPDHSHEGSVSSSRVEQSRAILRGCLLQEVALPLCVAQPFKAHTSKPDEQRFINTTKNQSPAALGGVDDSIHQGRSDMDTILIVIILLLLFGGGGGLYWGMGAGWGIGPIGLLIAVLVVAFVLYGRRGRSL